MDEKFETACFQIITYVGTARTHFINAIQCAKEGKYDEAAELIKQGDEAFSLGQTFIQIFWQWMQMVKFPMDTCF